MPKNTHHLAISISRPTARRRAVTIVSKAYSHDPHERIASIGGVNGDYSVWRLSEEAAIARIESGKEEFFVDTTGAPSVDLVVTTIDGQKYLQMADDVTAAGDSK